MKKTTPQRIKVKNYHSPWIYNTTLNEKHENHLKRHEKMPVGDILVNCCFSKNIHRTSCAGYKITQNRYNRKWFAPGGIPLLIKNFVKKLPTEMCYKCYQLNLALYRAKKESNNNGLRKYENEKIRLEKLGLKLEQVNARREKLTIIASEVKENSKSVVILFNHDMDNLLIEVGCGCISCSNENEHVTWKMTNSHSKISGIISSRKFVCSKWKHTLTWFNSKLVAKFLFVSSFIEGMTTAKVDRFFERIGASFKKYQQTWKKKVCKTIKKLYKKVMRLSIRIVKSIYCNGKRLTLMNDTQWKTKQIRGKRASSAHATLMTGDELLIVDHVCAHNNPDLLNDDGQFYLHLPPTKGISFTTKKQLDLYLNAYEEINKEKLTFKNYKFGWEEKIKKESLKEKDDKKIEKIQNAQKRIREIREKYSLDRLPEEFDISMCEEDKYLSIHYEYYLRKLGEPYSGNKKVRKERIQKYFQKKEEEHNISPESNKNEVVRCLEKVMMYKLFSRYPKRVGIEPTVTAIDGCKKSIAATVTYFINKSYPKSDCALDVYHGSGSYNSKWKKVTDEFKILEQIHYFWFFNHLEVFSRQCRTIHKDKYNRLKFLHEKIMSLGYKIEEKIGIELVGECLNCVTLFLLYLAERSCMFLHFAKTSEVESFHGFCNKYYKKGVPVGKVTYEAKMELAVIDWNISKISNIQHSFFFDWKAWIVKDFIDNS